MNPLASCAILIARHKRKSASSAGFALGGLDDDKVSPWLNGDGPQFKPREGKIGHNAPVDINMAKFYAELDFLEQIAANPIAKAKRLAFLLACTHRYLL